TGLAQVNGRNDIDWYERFKYDVEYVKDWNLKKDTSIFFKTINTVFKKKGVYNQTNQ
ncbi:MAG: sugar transferase, partial [Candidatus Moranbacteria bacterium]|nr:sugar transferase [Candidatus Moranbacteria bacterium]